MPFVFKLYTSLSLLSTQKKRPPRAASGLANNHVTSKKLLGQLAPSRPCLAFCQAQKQKRFREKPHGLSRGCVFLGLAISLTRKASGHAASPCALFYRLAKRRNAYSSTKQKPSYNRNLDKPTKLRYTQIGIRDMGVKPPKLDRPLGWNNRFGGTLLSLYEIAMVVLTAVKIVYDILSDLLRRWNKGSE